MPTEQDSFTSLGSLENFPASNPIQSINQSINKLYLPSNLQCSTQVLILLLSLKIMPPWAIRTCLKLLQLRGVTKQDLKKELSVKPRI